MSRLHKIAASLILCAGLVFGTLAFAQKGMKPTEPQREMTLVQAVVLGIVEGLTEYLPISSTGHLVLTQRAMGIGQTQAADAYAICIQLGAILAVVSLYFRYMLRMSNGMIGRDADGLALLRNIIVAFTPAAVVGFFVVDPFMKKLFGLWPIVAAWFIGGVAILVVAWTRRSRPRGAGRDLFDLSWSQALVIGLIQCLAIWPGTSRSLVTIVGGVLVGLSLTSAVIFSFILGAITLGAVTAYEIWKHGDIMLHAYGTTSLLAGLVAAALSATAAVKWMVGYLKRHGLALFGYYRVALAVAVAGLLLSGLMASR